MIKKYFRQIEQFLEKFNFIIEDISLNKKTYSEDKGLIEGDVFFINGSFLNFIEVVDFNKKYKEKYKYQYMDKEKRLIFRYDNAYHHPEIDSFPHHKHIGTDILATKEPNLEQVLIEIEKLIE